VTASDSALGETFDYADMEKIRDLISTLSKK